MGRLRERPYLTKALRTARAWGFAPSQFFALPSNDRLAMVALEECERTMCSCGHPVDVSTELEAMASYRARTVVCHACKAIEGARSKAPAGAHVYAEQVWDHRTDTALVDNLD